MLVYNTILTIVCLFVCKVYGCMNLLILERIVVAIWMLNHEDKPLNSATYNTVL